GAALDRLPVRRDPAIPETGKGEEPAIRPAEPERLLEPLAARLPFIEPIGQDQTAPFRERLAEGGPLEQRLAARVDHPVPDGRILCPGGDEPPTELHGAGLALLLPHCPDRLGRRDVEAGMNRKASGPAPFNGDEIAVDPERKATAHAAFYASSWRGDSPARPSVSRTRWASESALNGLCRNSKPGPRRPRWKTASSVYPDMNSTRMPGDTARIRSASSRPLMPGITTSVSRRSMLSGCSVAQASASSGLSAACTV